MEESPSDDDILEKNETTVQGGKKLKLNDGSSQDSIKDIATPLKEEKDENADSGVSADKSESTSSEDRGAKPSPWSDGPSNEVVNVAPSCSNVRAILLNIKRPKRSGRNYRKRKNTPDRDSDSNDSSVQDSDDFSGTEDAQAARSPEQSNSDDENRPVVDELERFASAHSDSDTSPKFSADSDSSSTSSYMSDDMLLHDTGDTDSDETPWGDGDCPGSGEENTDQQTPSVLLKVKPKHNWFIVKELIHREMGLTFPLGKSAKNDIIFEQKYYGSLHAVQRLELMYKLNKHRGCVNCINFHPEGRLLASGSDDMNVIIWDWTTNTALQVVKTGHKANVFQSKFLYLNARSQLNIVTCARDGQVRLLQCPPSGGSPASRRRLATHARSAHKLHVYASEPHIVISAGEDGLVMQSDVRADHPTRLFAVKEKGVSIPLYSVHGHPLESRELAVAGRDRFVRVYDRRKPSKPVSLYCPSYFYESKEPSLVKRKRRNLRLMSLYISCAIYNHDGTEILASYNDDDIYIFDKIVDSYEKDSTKEGYSHRYSGHRNSATFKGVSFFGPRSQFVVSGSDCSNIYIWERESEAIVQWMPGDEGGVVNCIESHPRCPVLASSGLDKDIKIWVPSKEEDSSLEGLKRVVKENGMAQLRSPLFNDFLPTLYSTWRGQPRLSDEYSDSDMPPHYFGGNIEFDGNVCTTF